MGPLTDLDALSTEHRWVATWTAVSMGIIVWMACDCGASIASPRGRGMTTLAPVELDARGRRLRAALAAVLVNADGPELKLVHELLDCWSGIGLIIAGMTHRGWDVQLTAYAARDRRANFSPVGVAHSVIGGSAWEPTPWRALQQAAWDAVSRWRLPLD